MRPSLTPTTTTRSFSAPVVFSGKQQEGGGKYCKYYIILRWFSVIETKFGTDILYIKNTTDPFLKENEKKKTFVLYMFTKLR